MGICQVAWCGPETVRERCDIYGRMRRVPYRAREDGLRLYCADREPAVRPPMTKIFCLEMIFSLMLVGCSGKEPTISATLNHEAFVTGEFLANPLQWRVITSNASTTDETMSTLFGNDAAVNYARTNAQHDYPNGATLAMVTWTQQEDGRWYGAQIPAA